MHIPNSRRNFVKNTLEAIRLITLPSLLHSKPRNALDNKKIVVVGGQPDDPESGCGGTVPLLVKAGYDVTFMYFTNGDANKATFRKSNGWRKCYNQPGTGTF